MAKQQSWGWVFVEEADRLTDAYKLKVEKAFKPVVAARKAELKPLSEPLQWNECFDYYTKWRGDYFYLMARFKSPPGALAEGFEVGIARLYFEKPDSFEVAYFRHTGKWFAISGGLSLAKCVEWIKSDEIFN